MGDWGVDILGRIVKSIIIKAPPEKIWEMLALDKFSEWNEGTQKNVESVEYASEVRTPEDKYRVGASVRITDNRGKESNMEIKESLENEKIVYRTTVLGGGSLTFILEPVYEGIKFTYRADYELPWGILGKFLDKLFSQRMGGSEIERSLEYLKIILEQ